MTFQTELDYRKEQFRSKDVRAAALCAPAPSPEGPGGSPHFTVTCLLQVSPERVPCWKRPLHGQPLPLRRFLHHCFSSGCQRACGLLDIFFLVNFCNTWIVFFARGTDVFGVCCYQGGLNAGLALMHSGALLIFSEVT